MTVTKRRKREKREVPIAWEALEDAFENNAPEVHSYLQFETGEVIRIVDGVADPRMHEKIARDDKYLKIDPVSSREQYRWMERFIDSVEDEPELQNKLTVAIDGKVEIRPVMYLALTYDHRLIDGREGVSFLVHIKNMIEDPRRLLLGV